MIIIGLNGGRLEKYMDTECIYVSNLSRKEEIAFIGKIGYFGGNLLMMKPKSKYNLENINSKQILYFLEDLKLDIDNYQIL